MCWVSISRLFQVSQSYLPSCTRSAQRIGRVSVGHHWCWQEFNEPWLQVAWPRFNEFTSKFATGITTEQHNAVEWASCSLCWFSFADQAVESGVLSWTISQTRSTWHVGHVTVLPCCADKLETHWSQNVWPQNSSTGRRRTDPSAEQTFDVQINHKRFSELQLGATEIKLFRRPYRSNHGEWVQLYSSLRSQSWQSRNCEFSGCENAIEHQKLQIVSSKHSTCSDRRDILSSTAHCSRGEVWTSTTVKNIAADSNALQKNRLVTDPQNLRKTQGATCKNESCSPTCRHSMQLSPSIFCTCLRSIRVYISTNVTEPTRTQIGSEKCGSRNRIIAQRLTSPSFWKSLATILAHWIPLCHVLRQSAWLVCSKHVDVGAHALNSFNGTTVVVWGALVPAVLLPSRDNTLPAGTASNWRGHVPANDKVTFALQQIEASRASTPLINLPWKVSCSRKERCGTCGGGAKIS